MSINKIFNIKNIIYMINGIIFICIFLNFLNSHSPEASITCGVFLIAQFLANVVLSIAAGIFSIFVARETLHKIAIACLISAVLIPAMGYPLCNMIYIHK